MFAALAVAALAGVAAFAGYKYGAAVEAKFTAEVIRVHTVVSAKLVAVKAEVAKIEAEAKAEEQAVVARLKAVLS